MYTYDSMLLMLKGYRRMGENIYRLTEELQAYKGGYKPKKQDIEIKARYRNICKRWKTSRYIELYC